MNTVMVIPTYWGRKKEVGWQEGDAIYDHPTPLDEEGTLLRCLESTDILKDKDFSLIIIGVSATKDIEKEVENKIISILRSFKSKFPVYFFSHTHLAALVEMVIKSEGEEYNQLLHLRGYSNVRNACLIAAHLLAADIAILIDDDELFKDSDFLSKAKEFMAEKVNGKKVLAKAGYYINPDGSYLINREVESWMTYWNKAAVMNKAFKLIIGQPPRIKETPFVFGGNLVVHRELFTKIPFDPFITRGEDIDFLINVRMFGHAFFLDNELSIYHYAPAKCHEKWCQIREDIYRFVYEKEKLRNQKDNRVMDRLTAENLDPYPGAFLKDNLPEMIFKSNQMLSLKYLQDGDIEGSRECQRNILLAESDALPRFNPFEKLIELQKQWEKLMAFIEKNIKKENHIGTILYSINK
jgi:hypothetical protein